MLWFEVALVALCMVAGCAQEEADGENRGAPARLTAISELVLLKHCDAQRACFRTSECLHVLSSFLPLFISLIVGALFYEYDFMTPI